MSDKLLSVGLDVGTTSTQLVVSELLIENRASAFAVPEMEITHRTIRYKGAVHFTPLLTEQLVDGEKIRQMVEREYRAAGICREDVDTGAIIITGETSRKENARRVLDALSDFAGAFVVATAGPDLESVLAAKGAGAVAYSSQTGETVLHMDIGGGTSNLALIRDGKIVATGCLNVGGRLLKLEKPGFVTYVSPVLEGLCSLKVGDRATEAQVREVAQILVQALEMAAGLREASPLLEALWTKETDALGIQPADWCGNFRGFPAASGGLPHGAIDSYDDGKNILISFSGGVADCIDREVPWLEFGDMGPVLGQCIRRSSLCAGKYRLGTETIRATVIGAGCHSAQLSGSTVFCQNVTLPMKNLPVVSVTDWNTEAICRELQRQTEPTVLAVAGKPMTDYRQIRELARQIARSSPAKPVLLCLEQDAAKALGQLLALQMGRDATILCIDRVKLGADSYLDVGVPMGPAFPVVVKTLVLGK